MRTRYAKAVNRVNHRLRREALGILRMEGDILQTARDVSQFLRRAGIPAVVIGGVAVVLHGYVRTTDDVDVLVPPPLEKAAEVLADHGFRFDPEKREFVRDVVPVHLVSTAEVHPSLPRETEVEGIRIATLADLISMKLKSGAADPLRAQDLADVIGLMRHHRLKADFARRLHKGVRSEFRKLARALQRERP